MKAPAYASSIAAAAIIPVMAFSLPAEAKSQFDGQWVVRAAAAPGTCSDRYGMTIRVADGRVIYRGLLAAVASGTVRPDGTIAMRLGEARVTGRLGTANGSGSWASPRCKGAWTAVRA